MMRWDRWIEMPASNDSAPMCLEGYLHHTRTIPPTLVCPWHRVTRRHTQPTLYHTMPTLWRQGNPVVPLIDLGGQKSMYAKLTLVFWQGCRPNKIAFSVPTPQLWKHFVSWIDSSHSGSVKWSIIAIENKRMRLWVNSADLKFFLGFVHRYHIALSIMVYEWNEILSPWMWQSSFESILPCLLIRICRIRLLSFLRDICVSSHCNANFN